MRVYVITKGNFNEVSNVLISLSYLLLMTACPIQFAEQIIICPVGFLGILEAHRNNAATESRNIAVTLKMAQ